MPDFSLFQSKKDENINIPKVSQTGSQTISEI
jgi:hypothetical protein